MKSRALLLAALCVVCMAPSCNEEPTGPSTCQTGLTMSVGGMTEGVAASSDCLIDDHRGDSYTLTLASQTTVRFQVMGEQPVDFRLSDPSRAVAAREIFDGSDNNSYLVFAVLPAGTYTFDIGIAGGGSTPYTVQTTALTPPEPNGCVTGGPRRFVTWGIEVAGAITTGDCPGAGNQYYGDSYLIHLAPGTPRTISVTATSGMNIEIRDSDTAALLAQKASNTAGTTSLTFAPSSDTYVWINLIAVPNLATGSYTLSIQ